MEFPSVSYRAVWPNEVLERPAATGHTVSLDTSPCKANERISAGKNEECKFTLDQARGDKLAGLTVHESKPRSGSAPLDSLSATLRAPCPERKLEKPSYGLDWPIASPPIERTTHITPMILFHIKKDCS